MSDTEESKPKEGKVVVTVVFPDDEPVVFRINKTTPFEKIVKALAQRKGVAENSFVLQYDGVRIAKDNNPKMLEMEGDVQIDYHTMQVGGFR